MTEDERTREAFEDGWEDGTERRWQHVTERSLNGVKTAFTMSYLVPWLGKNGRKPFFKQSEAAYQDGFMRGYFGEPENHG